MRHLILGTAGHIDHGKSALVKALTGVDPDRLKEEQRRGITIELGFADLELGPDHVVSFVDVPGHERFVRHMVAGATGIEAVLLVIAADQGVQPQTREHLDICSLLGLSRGLVALTKCDLVDPELREVVALEVREFLEGTFLEHAELFEVSARTNEGLEPLRAAFRGLIEQIPPPVANGMPRLPVDRSFVLKGFGTVVTGTLVSGTLHEGHEVQVVPGGRRGRVRGLQVHRRKVTEAPAGRRTAVNIQGLDCEDVPRGATLTRPGELMLTRRIWARAKLLPHAPKALARGGPIRFHQGTCERQARLRVLGRCDDGALQVEIRLMEETPLAPRDRFILRRPAPVDTVGGGVVVDVCPPPARELTPAAFDPCALEPEGALRLRLVRAGAAGRDLGPLAAELGLASGQLEEILATQIRDGDVAHAGGKYFDAQAWTAAQGRTLTELSGFHRDEPLRLGISREALRVRVGAAMAQECWRALLERLEREGKIKLQGERVALAGHEVVLDGPSARLAETIERRFREAALEPPEPERAVEGESPERAAEVLELLVARGTLVRIHDGKIFHGAVLQELRDKLRDYAKRSSIIDVAEFKRLAGVTRKHAIPLLEHLDAERTTRRVGDRREILPPA